MATWPEVHQYLSNNYEQDFGMKVVAGEGSFAALVPVEEEKELVLVLDGDQLLQFVVLFNSPKSIDVEALLTSSKLFGFRKNKGQSTFVMQHLAFMETLDAPEINVPLRLMASESLRIKKTLGIL